MEPQLSQVRDQQRQTWDKFSPGWKKWDEFAMGWFTPMGDEIIRGAQVRDTSHVLDVAAGTGEPGLTAASIAKNGKVVITDLSDGMLDVALENATRRGIKNIETKQCDACTMPFDDNSFDAITCRLGFMFFPDINLGLKEMIRVAKPGARISASVWNPPDKNPWATTSISAIAANVEMPPAGPNTPGLFRCATPGFMSKTYQDAGLKNISEKEVGGEVEFQSPEQYWTFMTDVVAPVVAGLAKVDEATREKIKLMVLDRAQQTSTDGKVRFRWSTLVISGEKQLPS